MGAGAVIALAANVIWRIHSSKSPVNTATVYAGDLAAVAIAVPLLLALGNWWRKGRSGSNSGVSTSSQAAAAANRLAEVTADRWREEAAARRIVTPAPATVLWRWAADEFAAPRDEVTTPPVPGTGPWPLPYLIEGTGELLDSGVVSRLHHDVYSLLPHGRLVLLGGPGAGKTGAMILLLLAALDRRAHLAADERDRVPVPVWLTLSRWDPISTTLQEWAVDTMNRDHPALLASDYGPNAADQLFGSGRVALFLDGLDEMPEGRRTHALKRIGDETRGLRVVLTSRLREYQQVLLTTRPENTAVIDLQPVQPADAAAYLLHGQAGPNRQQWEQLAIYLTQNPDSVASRALDNPLTLSLARDSYTIKDPTKLTDPDSFPTADAIREHLIDQILVTAYPDEHQRARITRWLAWIAHNMGPRQDLPWWDIPTWVSPRQLRLTRGLAIGLSAGPIIGFTFVIVSAIEFGQYLGLANGLWFGVGAAVVIGGTMGAIGGILEIARQPRAIAARWPRRHELSQGTVKSWHLVVLPIVAGISLGSAVGLGSMSNGARAAVLIGAVVALVSALAMLVFMLRNVWARPSADSRSATAAGTYKADRHSSIIHGFTFGALVGIAVGFAFGINNYTGIRLEVIDGLIFAVGIGSGAGIAVAFGTGQAVLVKFAEFVLVCQRQGQVHFLPLLEDAVDRQVLRQAGALYQFRHDSLQKHLTRHGGANPISSAVKSPYSTSLQSLRWG